MSAPEPFDALPQERNVGGRIGPKNVSTPPAMRSSFGGVQAQPDDASFETDFADLAARFAAKSGGGLSPELAADLALEIVLNEIVEQASVATGATGAAIVLRRDREMICRATSGATSPDLGSRLDLSGGLSGECVKTQHTVRCDDTLADNRADVDASYRLGVRSVMVMPLLRGTELVGAFELFSSRVNAFTERDERTLEVLAARTLHNLERASLAIAPVTAAIANSPAPENARTRAGGGDSTEREVFFHPGTPLAERSESALEINPVEDIHVEADSAQGLQRADFAKVALTAAVLLCTLLLGVVVGKHFQIRRRAARVQGTPVAATDRQPANSPGSLRTSAVDESKATVRTPPATVVSRSNGITIGRSGRSGASSVPPGGLRIYENGKEVLRLTPPAIESEKDRNVILPAAAIEPDQVGQLAPESAEESLLRRVEPQYPEQARAQKIQGAVVLDVQIGADGAVESAQVISGDPLLAQASTDAVKQWRFKPRTQDGHPARMQTRITLNFRLPQ